MSRINSTFSAVFMYSECFCYCQVEPRITTSVNFHDFFYFAINIMLVGFNLEIASVYLTAKCNWSVCLQIQTI
jgi:hypothetical protein